MSLGPTSLALAAFLAIRAAWLVDWWGAARQSDDTSPCPLPVCPAVSCPAARCPEPTLPLQWVWLTSGLAIFSGLVIGWWSRALCYNAQRAATSAAGAAVASGISIRSRGRPRGTLALDDDVGGADGRGLRHLAVDVRTSDLW